MTIIPTATWLADYKALGATPKSRVQIALRRLEADDPTLRISEVDPARGVLAAFVDEFLVVTFRPGERPGSAYLLNVRSIDITGPGRSE